MEWSQTFWHSKHDFMSRCNYAASHLNPDPTSIPHRLVVASKASHSLQKGFMCWFGVETMEEINFQPVSTCGPVRHAIKPVSLVQNKQTFQQKSKASFRHRSCFWPRCCTTHSCASPAWRRWFSCDGALKRARITLAVACVCVCERGSGVIHVLTYMR